eukprot:TRINITY_DN6600_c0_g1_i1.p2 TRINITY_DN6600_c0_g1~~TRINITY_DN6600_c0_g1_i1.p2  ORF type:complete len:111 (+),score=17.12 TRINITY_DN6600_c0_g1_i1:23-355(+)
MHRFERCQDEALAVYNAACRKENCTAFVNKINVHLEQRPTAAMKAALDKIDSETVSAINKATAQDQELYAFAVDLFWNRVAVMERVSGKTFSDLPDRYRAENRASWRIYE